MCAICWRKPAFHTCTQAVTFATTIDQIEPCFDRETSRIWKKTTQGYSSSRQRTITQARTRQKQSSTSILTKMWKSGSMVGSRKKVKFPLGEEFINCPRDGKNVQLARANTLNKSIFIILNNLMRFFSTKKNRRFILVHLVMCINDDWTTFKLTISHSRIGRPLRKTSLLWWLLSYFEFSILYILCKKDINDKSPLHLVFYLVTFSFERTYDTHNIISFGMYSYFFLLHRRCTLSIVRMHDRKSAFHCAYFKSMDITINNDCSVLWKFLKNRSYEEALVWI